MQDLGKATVYQIFIGWAEVLETVLSQSNLKPSEGYLLKTMSDIFVKTGH